MGIRVNRNISKRERQMHSFENFKGVDFTTSLYNVAPFRATQARNLIYENGCVRKRNGWSSLFKFDERIDGLFSFEIDDERIILCYTGARFYRLEYNEQKTMFLRQDITASSTYSPALVDIQRLVKQRPQVHLNAKKAYIVGCGDYLVFGKWNGNYELRRVYDNEDTYIPTTTINIDIDGAEDANRSTLDDVNLLSSYRKNEFLGVNADSGTWTVDTAIKGVEQAIDEDCDVVIVLHTYNINGEAVDYIINNCIPENKNLLYIEGDDTNNSVGEIDYAKGKVTLNINTKPQEEDTSNIIIKFKKSQIGQEELISSATISTVFGGGGSSNRLFLGGMPSSKNSHLWSELYDFTYFADKNYDHIGSDDSAILGYVRVSDGTLLVFKERNGSDSTVYYITGTDTEDLDYRGDIYFTTKFFKKAGNVSDTILGKYASASLNGDNLILTRNGICGLQMYDNIAIEGYRIQERSRNINRSILSHKNLKDACAIVYKDKYYISIGGCTYIADSRFTFQNEEDISGSYNYEWWYWDNVDANVWCEIDGQLFFGTREGLICRFSDEYADVTYQQTGGGELTVDTSSNGFTFNARLYDMLNENDIIRFNHGDSKEYDLYALLLSDEKISVENGYIYVSEQDILRLHEGDKVYADWNMGQTGLTEYIEYTIKNISLDNLCFELFDGDNRVTPIKNGFRLHKNFSDKPLFVRNILNSTFQVSEYNNGEILDIELYNSYSPNNLIATISYRRNICAEWYTPVSNLGSNMHSKTLHHITIATEPLLKSTIKVGYQTRNLENIFNVQGTRTFDFNDINFEDFSFKNSFASSYTKRVKERNFNYIVLRYISDNQYPCAVNSMTISYKINGINKGVR